MMRIWIAGYPVAINGQKMATPLAKLDGIVFPPRNRVLGRNGFSFVFNGKDAYVKKNNKEIAFKELGEEFKVTLYL